MITIPNLFGAYQKGREAAIEANWDDLKNYENIEAMRTRNDRDALQLLAEQADYNINRSMMRDNGDVSAMATTLTRERFPGDVYNARINALLGGSQYGTTMAAAADGRLQNYTDGQLMTTFNNGGTNVANSWVNLTDATARQRGLGNNLDAYYSLINNTVADNIAAGRQVITTNQATRPLNHATTVDNAAATAYQAQVARLFNEGKTQNPTAIVQTGADTAKSAAIAAQTGVVANQNTLTQTQNLPEEERKAKLAQLQNQRTLLLQNIQLAAQSGNIAAGQAMAAQYGTIDADIVRLGGKSQLPLVREAVTSALGVPPSTATTQVSPTPATQTPAVRQPPTQVPQQLLPQQPQPTYTPNGMDPRDPALANLFDKRAPVNPNQRVGAGGLTNDDWTRLANNAGVGLTGGYW